MAEAFAVSAAVRFTLLGRGTEDAGRLSVTSSGGVRESGAQLLSLALP